MAYLTLHAYVDGQIDTEVFFAFGAGPCPRINDEIRRLSNFVEDGDLDEELVRCVDFMGDWENLCCGGEPRGGWTCCEVDDVTMAICNPKELDRILKCMTELGSHVQDKQAWSAFAAFLRRCRDSGTICIWFDPLG